MRGVYVIAKPRAAFVEARRQRVAQREACARNRDTDPDVLLCRAERAKRGTAPPPAALTASKREFDTYLREQTRDAKKTASGKHRGRAISVPTSARKRILASIDDEALRDMSRPSQ